MRRSGEDIARFRDQPCPARTSRPFLLDFFESDRPWLGQIITIESRALPNTSRHRTKPPGGYSKRVQFPASSTHRNDSRSQTVIDVALGRRTPPSVRIT